MYAMVTGADIQPSDAGRLNTIINFASIIAMTLMLLQARLYIAAPVTLATVSLYASEYLGLAPHPAQLGAALFATLLPMTIVCLPAAEVKDRRYWGWIIVSTIVLALSFCIRQSIGMMGAAAAALTILYILWRGEDRGSTKVLRTGLLACAIIAASLAPAAILRSRDAIWNVPPPNHIEGHGIWHNVYIGLGAVPNKFGIEWRDEYAMKKVQEVYPSVTYVSDEYYAILRSMYFDALKTDPIEVFRIYGEKLYIVFQKHLQRPFPNVPWLVPLLAVVALSAAGIFALLRLRRLSGDTLRTAHIPAMLIAAVFIAFFCAQGMIIHPDVQYLFPVGAFVLIAASVSIDAIVVARIAGRRIIVVAT